MELFIEKIAEIIVSASVYTAVFQVLDKVYIRKYQARYLYPAAYLLSILLAVLANQVGNPFLNLFVSFADMNVAAVLLYRIEKKQGLIYHNVFLVALLCCDILSVVIWVLIKNEGFRAVLSDYQVKTISCMMNVLCIYVVYRIARVIFVKNQISELKKREVVLMLFLTIFEFFMIGIYTEKSDSREDGFVIIIILFGFWLLNMSIMRLIEQISKLYQSEYELKVMRQQNKIQLMHYQELSRQYQKSRTTIHDMRKHLNTLCALQSHDKERAEHYRKLIEEQIDGLSVGFRCRNQILSIVMGQKMMTAQAEGIVLETRIEDCELNFLEDMDITAIFANLWDNAIEACKKVDREKRYIGMDMQMDKGMWMLDMKNSFDGEIKERKNRILSVKEGHEGLGLGIIRETVEKYGGSFNVRYDGEMFYASILILLK